MNLLPDTTSASLINHVHHMDIFELCERVYRAGVRVDCILADLPYGTTACAWDEVIPFAPMWEAFRRVIKPRGAIVLTASQPFTSALVMSNLKMFRHSWMWDKITTTGAFNVDIQPMKAHEDICVFSNNTPHYYPQMVERTDDEKRRDSKGEYTRRVFQIHGNRMFTGKSRPNPGFKYPASVIRINGLQATCHERVGHPTQKPVALFRYLVRTYTLPGQLVFDPCCGSGTTADAARAEKRRYIVGDIGADMVAIARERLRLPFDEHHVVAENNLDDLPLFAMAAGDLPALESA